jgi:hypothetical protein
MPKKASPINSFFLLVLDPMIICLFFCDSFMSPDRGARFASGLRRTNHRLLDILSRGFFALIFVGKGTPEHQFRQSGQKPEDIQKLAL